MATACIFDNSGSNNNPITLASNVQPALVTYNAVEELQLQRRRFDRGNKRADESG